jgi:hypothetical protein
MRGGKMCACIIGVIGTWSAALPQHMAHAAITITKANGTAVPEGSFTISPSRLTDGYDIHLLQLYAQWSETVYNIHVNGGETIDSLFIDIDGPPAGSPLTVRVLSESPLGARRVGNVLQTGTAETQVLLVQATEDIGSVQAEVIGNVIAGRDVLGPIVSTTPNNSIRGVTWVQAGRDVLGDVTAELGRIGLVWGQRNIGAPGPAPAPGKPINIRCKHGVTQIAGLEVYAIVNSRANGGTGGLWSFTCDRYVGSMDIEKLVFNSSGGVDGRIAIRQLFDGVISMGKSYTSAAQYIELPLHGLSGQIIINADAISGGSWTAPVRVGPQGNPQQVVLTGPRYAHTSESLGGGAVGLVPFRLHDESCQPVNGQTAQASASGLPLTVSLRHFGPVTFSDGGLAPVTIDRRVAGSLGGFTPLAPTMFAFAIDPADAKVLQVTAPAEVEVGQGGFAAGYEYRIRPSVALKCDVPAQPAVVWDFDYVITVQVPPCDGDVNVNGVVNIDDLLGVIALWGQTNPVLPGADVNHDGIVNIDDLLGVISRWGPCE